MSLYDLKDLYNELKNDPMCREKILEYYRTTDLEEKDGDQSSLLHIAAEYGDSFAIEVLLNRGMDSNIEDSEAKRPLHRLAERERYINNDEELVKCVELLLDAKASVLRKDRFGRTAVILAAQNAYYEILKVFIDRELKLSLKDTEGNSALHIACQYFSDYNEEDEERYFKTIKYLLKAGLDPTEKNNDGKTAIDIAMRRCNKKVVALLLGNYDEENPNELLIQTGGLSLHRAIEKKDYEAVNALIKLGADINAFSEEEDTVFREMTPLGIAFHMLDEYSVKALLEAGADVNLKTTEENTALGEILGYMKDNYFDFNKIPLIEELLKLLLKSGLKINDTELHPKSWTQDWRCSFFVSKLTREDKIKIYERRKNGETIPSLAKAFNVQESNIKYLIALIKKHGYNILREDKNRVYSKDFKLQTINRILINHESINSVAIDIGLTSSGILDNWLSKFKENGYNVVEKKKGRKPKSMTKLKKNDKTLSEKEKIKQLEDEILYLKAENEYLKKLRALVQERELKEKKK